MNKQELKNKAKSQRILQAISETESFIERESARADDLRPADMQQHLDFCIAHKQKLIKMLNAL